MARTTSPSSSESRAASPGTAGTLATRSNWAAALLAAVPMAGLSFAEGGYFAPTWGWAAIGFLWVAVVALLLRPAIRLGRLDAVFLAGLVGLAVWMLVSTAWSAVPSESVHEAQRALVYVAAAAALLVVVEGRSAGWLLAGLLSAITIACGYALATRAFPEAFGVSQPLGQYRLAEPLGYWNALGLLAAIGAVIAIAGASGATRPARRAVAGALPVIFLPTLYLTFGRSAWLGLGVGLAVALAVTRAHRRALVAAILVLAPPAAVAVAVAASSPALTAAGAPVGDIADDGRRLAAAVIALGAVAALATMAHGRVAATLGSLPLPRLRVAIAVPALAAVLVAGMLAAGGPRRVLDEVGREFSSAPAPIKGDLDQRLFRLSGQGRAAVWSVAWDAARSHPVTGTGAGTFEQRWLQDRPAPQRFRDAHNLYLETLAELGPLGLLLLVAVLASPLVAAWRVRDHPLAPAAAGGLAAYLGHAAFDWDWEMPALTFAALACGVAALAMARSPTSPSLGWRARSAAVAAAAVLAALGIVSLVGNGAVGASITAMEGGRYATAEDEAKRARRWSPWSTEPRRWTGEARLAQGDTEGARRSFAHAARREPRNWALWYGLALASEGHPRRRALARAAALNPLSPEIQALGRR